MVDNNAKNRLGRGLAALIGDIDPNREIKAESTNIKADLLTPIEFVRANPNNPRRLFLDTELQDLANSISEHGIVQPILVRTIKDEDLAGAKYEIIAGERRWRAAQKAGLHEIPVLVREVADREALEIAIIENVQRTDLNPVEEAMGYQQLMDEYDYSQNELAQIIGKSRSHVANTLRLLKLPDEVCQMVANGALSAGHARTLITSDNPIELAHQIIRDGLSVRQAESISQVVENHRNRKAASSKSETGKNSDILALESRLSDALGLKVSVSYKKNGSGDVKVYYKNLEQLDAVCRNLES
jgi:ParB family chromosome partitioning protein